MVNLEKGQVTTNPLSSSTAVFVTLPLLFYYPWLYVLNVVNLSCKTLNVISKYLQVYHSSLDKE